MTSRLLLMPVALAAAVGPVPAAAQSSESARIAAAVDSIVAEALRAGRAAGMSVAVVLGGDTIVLKGYGYAELEFEVATPVRAIYEIGSVTKQFTAAAILQLQEQGMLRLDDELTRYLPDYPTAGHRITLRHLLHHTSGIRSYTGIPEFHQNLRMRKLPRDSLVALFSSEPFDFAPGEAMRYNNSGYFLLGLVIEKVSGLGYEEYVARNLFEPAGMRDSRYCDERAVVRNRAHGYDLGPDGPLRAAYIDHTWPYAAGSLCSTAGDLVAWNQALHGGRILSPASYRELTAPGTLSDGTRLRYAAGVVVDSMRGQRVIRHGGSINGFATHLAYFPDHELTITVLVNTRGAVSPDRVTRAIAGVISDLANLEPAPALPRAEPNDHWTRAGRMVDGELHVELEAVRAEWYPRGPEGPRVVTAAFAEAGGPPQVPGPLIRAPAGTPVRVSIRNTLDRGITVRGLLDRGSLDSAALVRPAALERLPDPALAGVPDFIFADSIAVPPGEIREARFTPSAEVTSVYFARTEPAGEGRSVPSWVPAGATDGAVEGAFAGGLVIDPPETDPPPDERFFLITQWGSADEPGGNVTFKMFVNGLSWPFTERLEYTVGDTVRWRLFNLSWAPHPMHLHGFYFSVDGTGDGDSDTVLGPGQRRLAVTERLPIASSLRLSWVPEEPGNWLFHCHLVRHMNPIQRFAAEGDVPDVAHDHEMHHMAGMILGITVRPTPGWGDGEPEPARRIDLWTGARPDVFDAEPELGFVVQEGATPPAPDSTRVPGSPLVLYRGEPTEIVVHNRLDRPLSVHWHGLELPSLYDGVGHWSGLPGAVRPPILPGESASVLITPPRAGSFMYHVHGEVGHELPQGLYGPFLVLEPGERWVREQDRVFVLAARGAELNAPPAVNGHLEPPAEWFEPAGTYRLRFLHISPDESKTVRLLRDGEPVLWRPLAKDGADLPAGQRVAAPAEVRIDVGETYDFEWTPAETGVYVLEVVTEYYPATGLPPAVQRVPFGVGDVPDDALRAAPRPGEEPASIVP